MMSLEEAFLKGGLEEKWEEKEFDINSLVEEVEELKFLNERKFMDFDELKKDNYELQLKLDDAEYAMDQVDELREICDKLEMEKKDALFREEAIKLQLDSLLQATSGDTRNRIEETIRRVYRTSLFWTMFPSSFWMITTISYIINYGTLSTSRQ